MATLLYLLTLAGLVATGLAIAIAVVSLVLWLRYRTSIAGAQPIDVLIVTHRATARPRPDGHMCVGPPEAEAVEDAHAR